jgi:hypothetical protein
MLFSCVAAIKNIIKRDLFKEERPVAEFEMHYLSIKIIQKQIYKRMHEKIYS